MPYRVQHIPNRAIPCIITSEEVATLHEADRLYIEVTQNDYKLSAASLLGDGSSMSWIEALNDNGKWIELVD